MLSPLPILDAVGSSWNDKGVRWVILGDFGESNDGDIDICIDGRDIRRAVDLLRDVVTARGWLLTQVLQHEVTCWYAVVARRHEGSWQSICLDLCSDYMAHGRRLITSQTLCRDAVCDEPLRPRPEPEAAFAYYVQKTIIKGRYDARRAAYLRRLAGTDMSDWATKTLGPGLADDLKGWLRGGPEPPKAQSKAWRAQLIASAPARRLSEATRSLRRAWRPSGLHVAISGPDGAGKSSAIQGFIPLVIASFRVLKEAHLFTVLHAELETYEAVAPYGQGPRGRLMSLVKVAAVCLQSHLHSWRFVRPWRLRSALIVNDRHVVDLVADPGRFRVDLPASLLRMVPRAAASPDLNIVLWAPPAVIQGRTQEVSGGETVRQVEAYRQTARALGLATVDTSADSATVAAACAETLLRHLAERQQRRGWPW